MPGAKNFFSKDEKQQIVAAIQEAENNTSGEIRVHLEESSKKPAYDRAVELFQQLRMDQTELHNGVLFYLAVKDHKFAIIGDKGIDEAVPENFWEEVKDLMQMHFKRGEFTKGLCEGIKLSGDQLKKYFPYKKDDINELPDDISFRE